jgi:hypothetical protein
MDYHIKQDALLRKYPALAEATRQFGPVLKLVQDYSDDKATETETVDGALKYLTEVALKGHDALVFQAIRSGNFTYTDLNGNPIPPLVPQYFDPEANAWVVLDGVQAGIASNTNATAHEPDVRN